VLFWVAPVVKKHTRGIWVVVARVAITVRVRTRASFSGYRSNWSAPKNQINKSSLRFLKGRYMKRSKEQGYWIFRPYITLRNGKIIWAYQYGLRAFRIWIAT
jgi:hypothetical protein